MAVLSQPGSGTNAATITNANASFGNQWDAIGVSGTGTTQTYDTAHVLHGYPTSTKSHVAAVSSTAYYQWKASISATANAYSRGYMYMTANTTVNIRLVAFLSGTNTLSCAILLLTTGALRTVNSAGATLSTTTATVPLNAWWRWEFQVTGISGSTGTVGARLYSADNLEGSTVDTNGSLSNAAAAVTGTVDDLRVGQSGAATQTTARDFWQQDMVFSDTAMPAPVGIVRPTVAQTFAVQRSANY